MLLAWLVLGGAFAGCSTPQPAPQDPLDDIIPQLRFDGERALARTLDVIHDENGQPRYRIPNTTGNDEAAQVIHDTLASYVWSVSYENFSGAEYRQLDLGLVSGWANSCSSEQYEAVASYRFHNVAASAGGGGPSFAGRPIVVLGAHYDSKRHATSDPDPRHHEEPILGADDGGSGVGILLELARALGQVPNHLVVRLVFFDGEDGFEDCHPLAGSLWHAQKRTQPGGPQGDLSGVVAFILLDMVGNASAQFYREGSSDDSAPWLLDEIWSVAARLGVDAFVNESGTTITDDHSSFIAEGVPSVDIINSRPGRVFPPYWHTVEDDEDVLDAEMMGNVGRVLEATIRLWAAEPERLDH